MAGGFGVGKSTFVNAISEIEPLRSEAMMTTASANVDDLSHIAQKQTTTVAMDFGRVALTPEIVLYLFGTPGQERFHFMWNELSRGAIGAVILADTRGWATASRRSTTSRHAGCRSSSPSTPSTANAPTRSQ